MYGIDNRDSSPQKNESRYSNPNESKIHGANSQFESSPNKNGSNILK